MMVKIGIPSIEYREGHGCLGQGYLFSLIFKPISTALYQGAIDGIGCTIEQVERRFRISIVDLSGVRSIKIKKNK